MGGVNPGFVTPFMPCTPPNVPTSYLPGGLLANQVTGKEMGKHPKLKAAKETKIVKNANTGVNRSIRCRSVSAWW